MSVHGGKFAVVNGQSSVRNWSVSDTSTPARGVNSATKNGTLRRKGLNAWTGSFGAHGAIPAVMPGEIFTFTGYSAPDNDVSGNGECYSGSAIVDSVVVTWNWVLAELLSYVVNFSGHLALSVSSSVFSDASTPDAVPVVGTKVQYDPGGGYVELDNITQVALTINAANQSFVNSSTHVGGVLWTGRKAGPIDLMVAISQQDNKRVSGIFNRGDDVKLKLFTDATNYWDIYWGHVREFTGLTVDRETGAIIARTINMDWNCYNGGYGRIRKPAAGADWWPV